MRVWVQGTVAIDRSSISLETELSIRSDLTLTQVDFTGDCEPAPFYLDYNDGWLHVPRAWFYQSPHYASFTSGLQDHRSAGFPLPSGTSANVTFGESPHPTGQPQFIEDIVAGAKVLGSGGGLCLAPTRAGKTLCALEAACRLGLSTVILVNDGELMQQWADNIEEHLRVPCGIIRQGRWDRGNPFTVAMTQTLVNRPMTLEDRRAWGTVIVDETDSAPCRTYWTALHRLHARHVLGLSATPDRKDGLQDAIAWIVGNPIASLERKLHAEVCWLPMRYTGGKITKYGRTSWVDAEKQLMDDVSRVNKVAELAAQWAHAGRRVLVMAGIVEHLDRIGKVAQGLGGDVGFYMGKASQSERDRPICVATYKKAAKGIDFALAPNLFIPAGPRADIRQAMGRALQPHVAETTRILDPVDMHRGLVRWAQKRAQVYTGHGFLMLNQLEPAWAA